MYGFGKPILGKLIIGAILAYLAYMFFFNEIRQFAGSAVGVTLKDTPPGQFSAGSQANSPPASED